MTIRRLIGLTATVLAAAAVAVLGFAGPARAHGAVVLTLHGDGRGSVWLTVVWQDGHPVTEPVGMTMLATSDTGQRVGPVALRRNGDALTYTGTLSPGAWTVVADMGTPAIGRCQGLLHVAPGGASPAPDEITCAPPPPAAPPAPAPAPPPSLTWVWYLAGFAVAAAIGIGIFFRKRR
ncbi:hypothetical protein [Dactylosporangium sp. CA-092794]|uniref:hypothetical protein n=1 Tax=Dactylosporangium sp. CA-092794 TaxID=3239929 RepID=UPI003D8D5CE7